MSPPAHPAGRYHTLTGWIDGLLPANTSAADREDRMRQRLLVSFGLLVGVPTLPWYAAMFLQDPTIRLPRMVALATILGTSLTPIWLRWLSTRAVAWLVVGLLHVAVGVNVLLNDGLAGPNAMVVTCLPVVTAVLLGVAHGWADAALLVATAVAMEWLGAAARLPLTAPAEIWPLARLMSLAIAVCLMLMVVTASSNLLRSQADKLARLAHSDPLTGLFNRHHLVSIMPAEMARLARRRRHAREAGDDAVPGLGFVLLDLDDFKRINDTWSHAVGDRALAAVGVALAEATRQGDVVARWGGEEFLVVLRDVTPEGLEASPRRLLEAVRRLRVPIDLGDGRSEIGRRATRDERPAEGVAGQPGAPARQRGSADPERRPSPPSTGLRLTGTLGFTHVPEGGSALIDGREEQWTAYVDLADRALLDARRGGKDRGLGYLWPRRAMSPDEVATALTDLPAALDAGLLHRVPLAGG